MPPRGSFGHYSLVAAGVALLGLLIYVQFSDFLPDQLPMSTMSGADALREQHPACALPKVPGDHAFVAASVLQGGAPTNLVIGTSTRVSRVVRVNVDSGSKPVSVFLTGHDVIWEFAGDVERVRRIVVLSRTYGPHAAVVGTAAERVEFVALRDCELVSDTMSPDEAPRTKALAAMFGRRPDHTIYEAKIAKLALPEGTVIPLPAQSPANEFNDLRRLDAGQVISAQPVTAPKILPGEVGLMQLAADGSIRQPSAEEVEAFVAGASRPYQSKLSPDFRFP